MPQQRRALRVVQLTLLGLAVWFGWMAYRAWESYNTVSDAVLGGSGAGLGEIVGFGAACFLCLGGTAAMGFRIVRGPEPPKV